MTSPAGAPTPRRTPPLDGVRVLDLTRFVAGPYATMLLADAGADVVKLEPIGGETTRELDPMIDSPTGPTSGYFMRFNRSKKSVCLDLRSAAGRDVFRRILAGFDVLVENFRPGVMDSLGLGYDELRAVAPSLIYCSISGYGHSPSPHREDPAFAILAEVTAGVVGRGVREDDPPVRLSAPLGDLFPASHAVSGICMALYRRERTGEGAHIDMAMYDALVSLNENAIGMSATTGKEVLPTGALTYAAPFGIFPARGGFICIAVLSERVWQRFCVAIDRPDLAADESLSSGSARAAALTGKLGAAVRDWLGSVPIEEAVDLLVSNGVPAGKVATPFDVLSSPQVPARSLMWDVPSYSGLVSRTVASPIRFATADYAPVRPIPAPGEHTLDVLSAAGLTAEELRRLEKDGVIGPSPSAPEATEGAADHA